MNIWRKTKNTIISKIKTEYKHDETYDLQFFIANPPGQMLKDLGKLVCVSMVFLIYTILNNFSAL
jgi:hypothetical protein